MDKKIFLEKQFLCPVCKKYLTHIYPNPRIYSASEREFDYHVTKYTWRQGINTDIKPHHYDIIQCPNCSFTTLRENFEKPSNSLLIRHVAENMGRIDKNSTRVLKELKALIKLPVLDFQSTVALHLAAIWLVLLEKDPSRIDHNNLGRLYLRLAWLYREKNSGGEKEQDINAPSSVLPAILSRMTASTQSLLEDTSDFRDGLIREFPELAKSPDPGSLSIINTKIEELNSIIYLLHQSLIRKKQASVNSNGSKASGDLKDHLANISIFWSDIPSTENAAIEMAVEALDFSYRNEDSELTVEQSMGLINLITKLLLKLGHTDRALNSVTHIYKTGYREKQMLQQRLAKGKKDQSMSNIDIKKIARKISTIEYTLQQAGHQRKEILEMICSSNKDKIEEILAENSKSHAEQEQALIDAGFNESVVLYLKEKGILEDKQKKKGWFKH